MEIMILTQEVFLFILLSASFTRRHGTDSFTSPLKEGVMLISIVLKSLSPRPGLNP
jgi:hypothetical protein